MSTNKEQSFIAENGITLGIIALALFVVLGVGLPRWVGDSESHGTVKISLPDSLSKNLNAADLESSVDKKALTKQGATEDQIKQVMAQIKGMGKTNAAEDRTTSHALGFTTASRIYISKDLAQQVTIRAFNGDGSAFHPGSGTASRVGDDVCFETSDSSTGATQAICSHASDNLTVQATAATKKEAAKYADQIFEKLA